MKLEIVCTGIGGRGVLLASAVLIETAVFAGFHAMASDELGMSQRGGSVVSMVKVGIFKSPFVGRENADAILSFEESEFYRNLPFLKRGGLAIVNSRSKELPAAVKEMLDARNVRTCLVDADGIAGSHGSIQASNMAMLGFFSHFSIGPYSFENILAGIGRRVAPRLLDMNRAVCGAGKDEAGKRL
ncbi:MAG: indolepyruvate oxidoreductase subunit beta [Syntrophorhabdaceae bacterium PtaU1.Bin034]|nr:MAG: indolepyruvate oxidoreductase subunit beta [Syntrophorhabdaceae bacterium PtaU1.Bin034]